jgi:hypothetical protein
MQSTRIVRPAPAGSEIASTRADLPPDGWAPFEPSKVERVASHLDRTLLRVVRQSARGISRRELLKRTAQVGLAVGLSTSTVLLTAGPAYARCYLCSDACGPSPDCGGSHCNDNGNCFLSEGTEKRAHDQFGCTTCANRCNCWLADCCFCSDARKTWCCDCCSNADPNTCDPPCDDRHACICVQGDGAC